ncbi:hypothetical protein SAMN06272737_1072 [Blastococcus mobilis]|uniref:Uncharacterized protein n=1 Tax=Blastococcus mobilis TaxID=1938746 RepID=A0A238W8Z7_9ACTN|nr:hypothetical protein SAMN06272737_1072 [Blastococcus mobilis]
MTRAMQPRTVARKRQDEPLAIARVRDYLGTEERLNRRAGVSSLSGDRADDDPRLTSVCHALAEARRVEQFEDHIRRVVDAAPPLTAEQRDKLALLLRASYG